MQISAQAPEFKTELLSELKARLGRNAIPSVAARCAYSDRYVRAWFGSAMRNNQIKAAAFKLLEELKEEEKAAATALQKV